MNSTVLLSLLLAAVLMSSVTLVHRSGSKRGTLLLQNETSSEGAALLAKYKAWTKKYHKFTSVEESQYRLNIFKNNDQLINEQNAQEET